MRSIFSFCCVLIIVFAVNSFGTAAEKEEVRTGSITGYVIDADTKSPLVGTNVILIGTEKGSATDGDGRFFIQDVHVGSYVLQFNYIGYEQLKKTDIIVRSERLTSVQVELKVSALETQAISVTAGYFSEVDDQSTSIINFSYEEIRRAPGSGGDISRIIMALPSIAKVNDQTKCYINRWCINKNRSIWV